MLYFSTTQSMKIEKVVEPYIHGLVQERRNSSANALELHLSCINHRYGDKVRNVRWLNSLHNNESYLGWHLNSELPA